MTIPAHIDAWVFDLDNTLYHPRLDLFGQIDVRMGQFIERLLGCPPEEARRIQKRFFHEHGTTLRGLMDTHQVEPVEFLNFVHDIDLGHVVPDPVLRASIADLPGRKLIFTNGDTPYARRVLAALGLEESFEDICCIITTGFTPKPDPRAYAMMVEQFGIDPARAVFFEDMARNLRPAKALGMTTVWVDNGSESGAHEHCPSYIDLHIHDLAQWLGGFRPRAAA